MTRFLFILLVLVHVRQFGQGGSNSADTGCRLAPDSLHPQYYLLEKKLAVYEGLISGWRALNRRTQKLKEGAVDKDVQLLRTRLSLEGYTLANPVFRPDSFDQALTTALSRFQQANGLPVTGKPDASTISTLNIPPQERLRQIRVNMGRWKKMPLCGDERYVFVNVADFRLELVEQDSVTLHMKVIVGRYYRKTPVIHSAITSIIFNPSWTVPPTILKKDILPEVLKDTSYLTLKHLKLLAADQKGRVIQVSASTVNWDSMSVDHFPYSCVQAPGPDNALGVVKFMLPNSYFVYLHDTPAKELFNASEPAFSSGCIRLSNAVALAEALLCDTPGWQAAEIEAAIKTGKTQVVPLSEVPVFIEYITAWVDRSGHLQFRKDIYNRDAVEVLPGSSLLQSGL